jgi:hypothetical protein
MILFLGILFLVNAFFVTALSGFLFTCTHKEINEVVIFPIAVAQSIPFFQTCQHCDFRRAGLPLTDKHNFASLPIAIIEILLVN